MVFAGNNRVESVAIYLVLQW